jgi:hypothetical protein
VSEAKDLSYPKPKLKSTMQLANEATYLYPYYQAYPLSLYLQMLSQLYIAFQTEKVLWDGSVCLSVWMDVCHVSSAACVKP